MAQADGEKLKLLVVDDESDNLDLLYRTFRHEFDVFRADSAYGALQVLENEGEMAIIISDQRMPKMKGTELLSRTVKQFPDTIRIVLTGYTDVEDLVEAINTGKVFKYITKPWNPTELKNLVQQAAETYRAIKRRTNDLHRALRRESVFNAMITAIRESLDYRHILETIVQTLGETFTADACVLVPIELQPLDEGQITFPFAVEHPVVYKPPTASLLAEDGQMQQYQRTLTADLSDLLTPAFVQSVIAHRQLQVNTVETQGQTYAHLTVPLMYQQNALAVLSLLKAGGVDTWSKADRQLIEDVSEQAALAISQSRLYRQIQEQTEQMRAELAVARQIQMHLLRQTLPDVEGIRIQAHCYPAREVGGDFFEVFAHPNGDLWLAVGDVSGKGVPAALFMSSTLSVLRRELAQESPPQPNEVLRNLNSNLLDGLVGSNCFITMVLARYSPLSRTLAYANAGHIFPMIWPGPERVMGGQGHTPDRPIAPLYLKMRGVPLGILPVWKADAEELELKPGDVLLLASDGITEARVTSDVFQMSLDSLRFIPSDYPDGAVAVSGDRTPYASGDYQMLKQQGLWRLLAQQPDFPDLEAILATIQAHSLGQEDDQAILSMEIL